MKNLLLILSFLFISTSVFAQGQQAPFTEFESINVSAVVQPIVNLTAVNDLDFGVILAGETTTIQPEDTEAGRIDITSSNNTRFFINWEFTGLTTVRDDISTETLPSTLTVMGSSTQGEINDLFEINNVTQYRTFSNTNRLESIFIGGSISPTLTQSEGEYTGTFTLTISDISI